MPIDPSIRRVVSLSLTHDVADALDRLAAQQGITRTAAVSRLIEAATPKATPRKAPLARVLSSAVQGMDRLRPFFSYFGSKFSLASKYPAPQFPLIIEPFAGSAGYSLRWGEGRDVWLNDIDPRIAQVWRYLVGCEPSEFLDLPIEPNKSLTDVQRWLLGWRIGRADPNPKRTRHVDQSEHRWSPVIRGRLADQLPEIRDWRVTEGQYLDLPDVEATWFIDPPYQQQGTKYRHGSRWIDYNHLADWCRSRSGQVIVCESSGAEWLPFRPLPGWRARHVMHGRWSAPEMIWHRGPDILDRIASLV